MKIVWVAYDTLHKILSQSIDSVASNCLGNCICVMAMSDYLTSAGPAWFDLFRKHISQHFLGSLYFFAQMLLTSLVIICSLVLKMYSVRLNKHSTGGLRSTAFIGRILGLAIYILLGGHCFWQLGLPLFSQA